MFAAVVEIAAPTVTRVVAAWSVVLINLRWGWPPRSVPVIFKLHRHWKSYQMTMPNDHWFCVCHLSLNKLFVKFLLDAQTVQSPSLHQDVAVAPPGGESGTIVVEAVEQRWWQQWWQQGHCDCQRKQEPWLPQRCLLCAGIVVVAADNGGTSLRGLLLMLTPLRISCQRTTMRRGGDPLSSKWRSYKDNDNNHNEDDNKDAVIARASKNDDNHNIVVFVFVSKATERQQQRWLPWQQQQQGCCDCQLEQE